MMPNLLTALRLVAIVPLVLLLLPGRGAAAHAAAFWLFLAAGLTDFCDGALARRLKCSSAIGVFFDPLADKVLADVLLVYLAVTAPEWVNVWLVLLMMAREFAVQGFRSMAPCKGIIIRTRMPNKLKFGLQFSFLAVVLAGLAWPRAGGALQPLARVLLELTVAVAYVSMATLFWQNRDLFGRSDARVETR